MPQLIVENYPAQLFWLLVTFGILLAFVYFFAYPLIQQIIDKRNSHIKGNLSKAQKLRKDIEKLQKEYDSLLDKAKKQVAKIVQEENDKTNARIAKLESKFAKDNQARLREAKNTIARETKKAEKNIVSESDKLAHILAQRLSKS